MKKTSMVPEPIPTPLPLLLRRLRYKVIPALTFALALAGSIWLWSRQGLTAGPAVGEVSVVTLTVTAPRDGKLSADGLPYPQLYDRVTPGQRMATLMPDSSDAATAAVVLSAPAAGAVTAVRHHPGEFVKKGDAIFTVTSAQSPHILTFAKADARQLPVRNAKVTVRSKNRSAVAVVQEVGAALEPIPAHQLTNPRSQEWGIPIRISLPDPAALPLMPGQIVHLTFVNN